MVKLDVKPQSTDGKKHGKGKKVKGVDKSKTKRPLPQKTVEQIRAARKAISKGEVTTQEVEVRKSRDLRTLYVRFKDSENLPSSEDDIRPFCPYVQAIRIIRQGKKKTSKKIKYCFMEFETEAVAEKAKLELESNREKVYADYVGEKSRNVKFTSKPEVKRRPINPVRLMVTGFSSDMTSDKLKMLFPKSHKAEISTTKSPIGFVTFHNAGEAKAAFDSAQKLMGQDLPPGVPRLTVVYAVISKATQLDREMKKKEKLKEAAKTPKVAKSKKEKIETEVKEEVDENEDSEEEEKIENDEDSEDEVKIENDEEKIENDEKSEDEEMVENDEESGDENVENDEESEDENVENVENDEESEDENAESDDE